MTIEGKIQLINPLDDDDEDKETEFDPFLTPCNMDVLRARIDAINENPSILKEHDLVDVES